MLSLALRIIPAKRVYNFVARSARITRGSQADCDFALVMNLSFYRFSIRSCLATSHKQILNTPFSMASSCILGFQATRPPTWAHFIHPLANRLENRKVFPRQITAGCKHNSARLDKWLEFLALEDLTPNERWRRRPVRSAQLSHGPVVWSLTFCRRRKLGCSFQSGRGYFHFFFHRILPFGLLLFILIADPF